MRPPATSMISVTSLLEQPSKTVTTPSLTTSSASTVTMSMSWRESLVLAELSLLVLLSQLLIGKIVLICLNKFYFNFSFYNESEDTRASCSKVLKTREKIFVAIIISSIVVGALVILIISKRSEETHPQEIDDVEHVELEDKVEELITGVNEIVDIVELTLSSEELGVDNTNQIEPQEFSFNEEDCDHEDVIIKQDLETDTMDDSEKPELDIEDSPSVSSQILDEHVQF